jgi:hypothetical protein
VCAGRGSTRGPLASGPYATGARKGTRRRLEITFRSGCGRIVSDGCGESGTFAPHDTWLNLHEPGGARRLLDAAAACGPLPARAGTTEADGWPLFDAVTAAGPEAAAG